MRKWHVIPSWPEYELSVEPQVCIRRITPSTGTRPGKELKYRRGLDGYMRITLCRKCEPKTFTVHALVAEVFIGKRPMRMQINHKDSNKANNHPSNLEYVTARKNGEHHRNSGRYKPYSKLTVRQVMGIRALHATRRFEHKELAEKFGVSRENIGQIVNRHSWRGVV